ncbi:MAG: ankyrin repeat domain-containing protein [Gammaproteobacteria bacterium]|nr:ankyrin repeat domain-containing protein [Gammaproteobacteria bacterium]
MAMLALVAGSGCVVEEYCDRALPIEWGLATLGRENDMNVQRKPTAVEARKLRRIIGLCKSLRTEFELTDFLSDNKGLGTESVISLAVELDDISLLSQLVSEGHSINGLPNSFGISPIYFATYRQKRDAFFWLLENGADPNLVDGSAISPLMVAAASPQDRIPSVQALVEAGAIVDARDEDGRTALVWAVYTKHIANARLLAAAGADAATAREFLTVELATVKNEMYEKRLKDALIRFDANFEDRESK